MNKKWPFKVMSHHSSQSTTFKELEKHVTESHKFAFMPRKWDYETMERFHRLSHRISLHRDHHHDNL